MLVSYIAKLPYSVVTLENVKVSRVQIITSVRLAETAVITPMGLLRKPRRPQEQLNKLFPTSRANVLLIPRLISLKPVVNECGETRNIIYIMVVSVVTTYRSVVLTWVRTKVVLLVPLKLKDSPPAAVTTEFLSYRVN